MEQYQSIRLKNKALKILKKWSYQMDMPYSEAIIKMDELIKPSHSGTAETTNK